MHVDVFHSMHRVLMANEAMHSSSMRRKIVLIM